MATRPSVNESDLEAFDQILIRKFHDSLHISQRQAAISHLLPSTTEGYINSANVAGFHLGIGENILHSILPAIESAQKEVILVTCFWARSAAQQHLADTLRRLAKRAQAEKRLVNVRICFSSLSIWQKLTHTRSLDGQTHDSGTWPKKFGLPKQSELLISQQEGPTGVSLSVKSIFVMPFSVMHPKFVIIDQQRGFLPSCNVSWEDWFEGCIVLQGGILRDFLDFYHHFWERKNDFRSSNPLPEHEASSMQPGQIHRYNFLASAQLELASIPAIFLPSPHNSNPQFRPFWFQSPPAFPPTPLNIFLLALFNHAQHSIYIQTPNVTSPPVFSAIMAALQRGVDIRIVTSSRMMLLEQLVTAGTTTELCIHRLIKQYQRLIRDYQMYQQQLGTVEDGRSKPGDLQIRYYCSRKDTETSKEPVKSHLKLTIVDQRIVVLGS